MTVSIFIIYLGPEYKAFLEDFNNLILHKVTDFDELISQIEEKEKKMEKGMISETPLVKFLVQQAVEKVLFISYSNLFVSRKRSELSV